MFSRRRAFAGRHRIGIARRGIRRRSGYTRRIIDAEIPGFSVGKMFTGFNLVVYALCAVLFNPMVALYSIIYSSYHVNGDG